MAVLALTSAKGAPGVSTTALAMTLLWPRPTLLAECDPAGSSSVLAGYLRGAVEHTRGLLPLALAQRHEPLEQSLWSQTVPLAGPAQAAGPDDTADRWLMPGLSDAAQAPSTVALWGPLGSALAGLERAGTDVVVDAGRLGNAHAPTPLLRQADLVLLVMGTDLPAVAAARARLNLLRDDLSVSGAAGRAGRELSGLGLLLVGEGRPYTSREIASACGVPVVACLAWDPASAEVLAAGALPGRRFATSPLVRTARAAVSASLGLIQQRRTRLAPRPDPAGRASVVTEAATPAPARLSRPRQ